MLPIGSFSSQQLHNIYFNLFICSQDQSLKEEIEDRIQFVRFVFRQRGRRGERRAEGYPDHLLDQQRKQQSSRRRCETERETHRGVLRRGARLPHKGSEQIPSLKSAIRKR